MVRMPPCHQEKGWNKERRRSHMPMVYGHVWQSSWPDFIMQISRGLMVLSRTWSYHWVLRYTSSEEMVCSKSNYTWRNEREKTCSQDDPQKADVNNCCGSCLAPVTGDDSALMCEICEYYWHHIHCENMSKKNIIFGGMKNLMTSIGFVENVIGVLLIYTVPLLNWK